MFYSHYIITKYASFEPIIYVINLDDTSFFKVFSEFDSIFLLNVLLV